MNVETIGVSERKTRKYLGELIIAVRQFEAIMDVLMLQPSTVERGRKIAAAMNALNGANDVALYIGLGLDHWKDKRGHKGNLRMIQKFSRKMYREVQ